MQTVKVYISLLEEGSDTLRPTQAIPLEKHLYQLLPTPNYDPEDETWEFLPGSVVRCDSITLRRTGQQVLRAYAVQNEDGSFSLSKELPDKPS